LEAETTTRCNLDCQYCYNRGKPACDLPLDVILDLIRFSVREKIWRFVVSGGEACLHPDFEALAQFLLEQRPGVETVIQSNGLIGRYDPELLKGFQLVHLSLEPEETGVRETSVAALTETALELKAVGIRSYFFVTVHPGNVEKIDWLVDLANEVGIDIGFNLCVPVRHRDQMTLSPKQRVGAIRKLYQLAESGRILRFTSPFTAMLKGTRSDQYLGNRGGCTAGIASCVVLPNGDVIPCPFFRLKAGNIFEQDLEEIWLGSEMLAQMRIRSQFDKPCGSCEYLSFCGGCRARAYTLTGRLNGADPDCPEELKEGST